MLYQMIALTVVYNVVASVKILVMYKRVASNFVPTLEFAYAFAVYTLANANNHIYI